MMKLKTIATTLTVTSVLAFSGVASAADSPAGFYLAYSPGLFVEYLSLNDSGREGDGYFEAIRATPGAATGVTRTQMFGKRNGAGFSFGPFTATKSANGFTLTSITHDGQLVQQSFAHTSIAAINSSIAALSSSVNRGRAQLAQSAARAELRSYDAASADDSARLGKAQAAVDAAAAQLGSAQTAADRLSVLARQARQDANSAIDKPGVSLAQNQQRIDAMKMADDTEQNLVGAQRTVNGAENALVSAKAEVLRLRLRIADTAERARAIGAHLATNETVGP